MTRRKCTRLAWPATLVALVLCAREPALAGDDDDDDDDNQNEPVARAGVGTTTPREPRPKERRETRPPPPPNRSQLPRPDEANGFEIAPGPDGTAALWLPRAVLFVPRLAFEIVGAPIRGGVWAVDRYQLHERALDLFFNDARTFGIFPIAAVQSGFGLSGGAQLVHRDLFGDGEHLGLRAAYGGRYRQIYDASIDSGDRLGRLELELAGEYELKPRERFFGIGNADEVPAEPEMTIDPLDPIGAVSTRYRETGMRAALTADVNLPGPFGVELRGAADRREFDRTANPGPDVSLEDVYDTSMLPGYSDGTDAWIGQLRLSIDTRRNANPFVSEAVPGAGALISGHGGYNHPITDDRDGFWRYGGDVQYFINVFHGSRVLGLRALVDQVHSDVEDVPFVYLPSLGGADLLRGYHSERFRDRALTMASAEYKWELSRYTFAYLFVDAGRVQASLTDPSTSDPRVGYGGGVQLQTRTSFLMRTHVASSIDGGIFFNLSFDPVIDARVDDEED